MLMSTSTQWEKINDFENDALKVILKRNLTFEFFWEDTENVENDANTLRTNFFIFLYFENI
jgi:hypothetical protein